MDTVGPGIWREHGKNEENETQTLFKLNWQETLKMGKMRNAHCKTWSMVRKMKIVENEKHTQRDLKFMAKNGE